MSRLSSALSILSLATVALEAQAPCQSVRSSVQGIDLDIAPPSGFVEICSQDSGLCRVLTAGYPPSVTTIGYFVTPEEWRAYKQAPHQGFKRYLIAQLATSMFASDLAGFKQHLHEQQGIIPDHSRLPATLESEGRVSLGIFDESDSSISFGTIMKLQPVSPSPKPIALVATNSAVITKGRMLSLYVFRDFQTPADADATEQLTREWLACIRQAK